MAPTNTPESKPGWCAIRATTSHYTPTYASLLNQVERWFALITQRAIRRGSFRSVRELVHTIDQFVRHYNTHKRPFMWTATADSILQKLGRLCEAINGTEDLGADRQLPPPPQEQVSANRPSRLRLSERLP